MSRRRRGRGEGSIYRRPDGSWCGILTVGWSPEGKQVRRYVYRAGRAAVVEAVDKLRADLRSGLHIDTPRMTLGEFLSRWLDDTVRVAVRPSTYARHKDFIRLYIAPHLGGVPLSRVTPMHIQSLLADLERAQKSPRLRQMVRSTLHAALNRAVKWDLIPRNPCDAVEKPRAPRPEMKTLTKQEVDVFLQAAQEDRLYALYVLAVTTGMRQGELFGLQWSDVDLKTCTLSVRRQLTQSMTFVEPKTKKACRQILLPQVAVTALQTHRKQMLAQQARLLAAGKRTEWNSLNLIFTDGEGNPLRASNFLRRSFFPLLKKAGTKRVRFHDLRHTAATLLLQQNIHPKIVQELLGHSTVGQTLDTYSHVTPTLQKEAATKMDALFAQ